MKQVSVSEELLRQAIDAYDSLLPTLPGLQDNGSRWLRDRLIKATDDLRAALDAPAVEPVGYVRMLNGEPTPDDNGYVFSYGKNPYRDTYGDEQWLPVSVAAPQAQHPSPTQRTCNHGCNGCDDCTDFDKGDV